MSYWNGYRWCDDTVAVEPPLPAEPAAVAVSVPTIATSRVLEVATGAPSERADERMFPRSEAGRSVRVLDFGGVVDEGEEY